MRNKADTSSQKQLLTTWEYGLGFGTVPEQYISHNSSVIQSPSGSSNNSDLLFCAPLALLAEYEGYRLNWVTHIGDMTPLLAKIGVFEQ